jgi:putative salt-induced outer membrane protein
VRLNLTSMILCAALVAPAAQAQWTGKAELGFLNSTGNAESTSANAKLDLKREAEKWINTVYFGALYGNNGEFTNAERFEARYQLDYKINDKLSWFGALRGEKDYFSGFVYQATVSTGVAYKFIDTPVTKLAFSVGAGYRRLQEEVLIKSDAGEVLARIEGEENSEPVGTVGSTFEHNFTENTKITNKFLAEAGSDNTAIQDDLALQVSMSKKLALAVGYGVRYNTDPPPLAESTDTLMTVNLVYNIP